MPTKWAIIEAVRAPKRPKKVELSIKSAPGAPTECLKLNSGNDVKIEDPIDHFRQLPTFS